MSQAMARLDHGLLTDLMALQWLNATSDDSGSRGQRWMPQFAR
jgi:hypothetical protein